MIQLQMISYIIKNNRADLLRLYDESYFPTYQKEFKYIKDHYNKYKKIISPESFVDKFPALTVLDVNESDKYLKDKLFEEHLYDHAYEVLQEGQKMFNLDSKSAVHYILQNLPIREPGASYGVDIIKNAEDRYNIYLDRANNPDTIAYQYSTGLPELDEVLGGLRRGEEVVVLYARTNNGKTWIAEKMAVSVWEQGGNVGFFEPEMSDTSVGYRFDTLFSHLSNSGLQVMNNDINPDKYKSYIQKLSKHDNIFDVTTPKDFDKKVTVSKLQQWVIDRKLDLLVIDGITYLSDERTDDKASTTDRLTNIAEDLMTLSVEMSIPIVVVVQANRSAARDSDGEVSNDAPELDTIRNSDGISHNASRAISVTNNTDNGILKLKITKNRFGSVHNILFWNWDINVGKFTYVPNDKANLPNDVNEKIAEENRKEFADTEDLF